MRIQVEIIFKNQMDNMSRDKVEHYYLLTASTSFNIWNATCNPHKEDMAVGNLIRLGKYLLGSVYHMLHQTTYLMHTSQKISCVNGPWWFVQMRLQLYMHQIVGIDLNNRHFPSANYKEGETQITKGCQTYGEAASTISIDQNISQLFELFFKGFANPL
jgi:hypothetical protein